MSQSAARLVKAARCLSHAARVQVMASSRCLTTLARRPVSTPQITCRSCSTQPDIFDLKGTIENNPVVVYSKSTCPFCARVKTALEDALDVSTHPIHMVQLDQLGDNPQVLSAVKQHHPPSRTIQILNFAGADGATLQGMLLEQTGQRTVPNVFFEVT